MKINKKVQSYIEISFGILLVDLGFYFFLTPTNLVTGGVMGLSLIFKNIITVEWLNISYMMYGFNIITLILGWIFLGKDFFIKTIYASLLSPTIILLFELFVPADYFLKNVTESKLLVALVCNSLLTSIGLGISIRNNGSSGGMDAVQLIMSKYMKIPLSKSMYFTDLVIVLIGAFTFTNGFSFNIEMLVFGSLTVFIIGYLVDFIALHGRLMRTAYIITDKPEEIKSMIFNKIGRGLTFCSVQGGYTNDNKTMIICTMDKSESYRLRGYILEVDSRAFTFLTSAKEVIGEYEN